MLGAPMRATKARRTAWGEREVGQGGLLRDDRAVSQDDGAAIEQFTDFDVAARVGASAGPARDLDQARAEAHGVVAGDDARIAAAKDAGEVARRPAPYGRRRGRAVREAAIEVTEEAREERVGGLAGGDAPQAQFADEPILERAPQPFDPALALRTARLYIADAELLEHPAEMRGGLHAGQLLRQAPVLIAADEDANAIAIEGHRQPDARDHLLEHDGVAMQVFGGAEVQRHDLGRGIVDGAEQGHRGPPTLEPVKGTAIDLHELARCRFARAPTPMLGRPPAMHRGEAERPTEPT